MGFLLLLYFFCCVGFSFSALMQDLAHFQFYLVMYAYFNLLYVTCPNYSFSITFFNTVHNLSSNRYVFFLIFLFVICVVCVVM